MKLLSSFRSLMERLFPSLRRKIALAIIGVSMTCGFIFVYFAQETGYSVLQQDARTKAHDLAVLFQGVLENAMMEGNQQSVAKIIRSVGNSQDVFDAALIRRDGTVILDGQGNPVDTQFPYRHLLAGGDSTSPRYMSVKDQSTMFEWVVLPVPARPQCRTCHVGAQGVQGYIALKVEVTGVKAVASQHRALNVLMALITFVGLGGITYVALSVLVVTPLGKLHDHIRTIEGQLSELKPGEQATFALLKEEIRNDEIADLTRDFNGMVTRINTANERIYALHQSQLEHADRMKSTGEMAAGLAHEIKNPIAGVIGALQVFEGDMTPDDPKREILAEMLVQLDRVNHTITDLLQYARPSAPKLEPLQINDAVQKTVSLLMQQFKRKNILLQTSLSAGSPVILGDAKQLQQVFWNVMLNALQAMTESGELVVATGGTGDDVWITISDTGCGIAPENIEKIFKPFFTTKHKGTGLGMTISRRIVELHGGVLELKSVQGKGTTVTVRIPAFRSPIVEPVIEPILPIL